MLLSFNKSRHASHSQSGLALLTLLFSLFFTFILSAWLNEKRRQSPVVENPYPPFLGKSYPEDTKPTVRQKQWALATCSVLTEINRRSQFILPECTETNNGASTLRRWWGISNRTDMLATLRRLEEGGHRKGYDDYVQFLRQRGQITPPPKMTYAADIHTLDDKQERILAVVRIIHKHFGKKGLAGWDFSRYVSLCRWGVHCKYLTEEEAWMKIMPVARMLQSTFSSWEELAYNYRLGRIFWSPMKDESDILKALDNLRRAYYSPRAGLSWNTNLLPEQQCDDGQEEYVTGRAWEDVFGNRCDDQTLREYRKEAFKWFQKSAAKGNVSGMYFLAHCYYWGLGCQVDRHLYKDWIQQAVAKGDPWSHYQWGMYCYRDKSFNVDQKRIVELISFSATNNGAAASISMQAWIYENEYGGTKKDLKKALDLYYQAAATEDSWAMNKISDFYHDGRGVKKDLAESARWCRRAAVNGDNPSMFYYAECLRLGEGIPTNTIEALTWYRRAATNNETRAINYLKSLEDKKPE